uniref:Uncharacterized protein n=1 Tax=viral metagenome TaxID=1070528 RepID=A0A6C0IDB1_9ZZZZ
MSNKIISVAPANGPLNQKTTITLGFQNPLQGKINAIYFNINGTDASGTDVSGTATDVSGNLTQVQVNAPIEMGVIPIIAPITVAATTTDASGNPVQYTFGGESFTYGGGDVLILTGKNVTNDYLSIISPTLSLGQSSTNTPIVKDLARTYILSGDGKYIKVIYSFKLLAALLDSAPTANSSTSTTIFQMQVQTYNNSNGDYIVNAEVQTLGNSTKSPTYDTVVTANGTSGLIYFPVTNFFSVTSPGAPYTITLMLTKVD